MRYLLLVLALLAPAALADAQVVPYEVWVTTLDSGGVARLDSFHLDKDDARARRAAILRDGWTITSGGGVNEDAYPPHAIIKATVVDHDPQPPQCPPDCPAPQPLK